MLGSLALSALFLCMRARRLAMLDNAHEQTRKVIYGEIEVLGAKFSSECVCKGKPQPKHDARNCLGLSPRLSSESLLRAADLEMLPLVAVSKQSFSCIDGRVTLRGYSTPGGDAGEFLLALHLYEHMSSPRELIDYAKIKEAFEGYLRYTRADSFAFCTDEKALKALYRQAGVG